MSIVGMTYLEPASNFADRSDRLQQNLEAQEVTSEMMNSEGSPTDWETDNVESFGLAAENEKLLVLDRDKIKTLNSLDDPEQSGEDLGYNQFVAMTGVENQYLFNFTWFPTVTTFENYEKNEPPEEPYIREPTGVTEYGNADDKVHYGNATLEDQIYKFLITSQNGEYQDVYISQSWDFRGVEPIQKGQTKGILPDNLDLEIIQNQPDQPGTMLIFRKNLRQFGAQRDRSSRSFKFNRYGMINDGEQKHPIRVEVTVW